MTPELAAAESPGPTSGAADAEVGGAEEVRPLELFFDLVFVFTITQVGLRSDRLPDAARVRPDVRAAGADLVEMYRGYAWLTNALDLDLAGPRLLVLAGAAGFFVMSLTVPKAVGPGPWAVLFGASYLLVVTVHLVGFIGTSGHRGLQRVGPLNIASALVVLAAGAVSPHARCGSGRWPARSS